MRTKHSLLMFISCLVPLGVLFALPFLGIGPSSLSFLAVILLCPLLHLLVMRGAHNHPRPGGADMLPEGGNAGNGDEQPADLPEKGGK